MSVDYSERAVTIRIRQVSQLRKLGLSLPKAPKPAPPAATRSPKQ
jgi:hypothetical protein